MPWVKVSDDFYDHPKFFGLSDRALALWFKTLAWSARNLRDGLIPTVMVQRLGYTAKDAHELEAAGLWTSSSEDWVIHDYLDYQPSGEDVRAKRSELSEVRSRAGRRGAEARWQTDGKPHGKDDGKPVAEAQQDDGPEPEPEPPLITFSPPPTFVGDKSARVEEALSLITARERVRAGSTIRNLDGWTHTVIERNRYDHGSTLYRLAHEHPNWAVEQLADSIAPTAFAERPPERPICVQCNRHTLGLYECPPNRPDCPTTFRCPDELA